MEGTLPEVPWPQYGHQSFKSEQTIIIVLPFAYYEILDLYFIDKRDLLPWHLDQQEHEGVNQCQLIWVSFEFLQSPHLVNICDLNPKRKHTTDAQCICIIFYLSIDWIHCRCIFFLNIETFTVI